MSLTLDGEAYLAACSNAFHEIAATEAAPTSSNRIIGGEATFRLAHGVQPHPAADAVRDR
jgi:hypothetical protein